MRGKGRDWAAFAVACLIAVVSGVARAQTPEMNRPWSVFAGFSSHAFSEPGLHLGGEYALVHTPHLESLLHVGLLAYGFGASETGYALHARWGQRYSFGFGLTLDSYIGLGAQYTVWETSIFRFKGARAEAMDVARSGASVTPHVALGAGYDLSRVSAVPVHVYARAGIMALYPDLNEVFNLSAFAELGVRWML